MTGKEEREKTDDGTRMGTGVHGRQGLGVHWGKRSSQEDVKVSGGLECGTRLIVTETHPGKPPKDETWDLSDLRTAGQQTLQLALSHRETGFVLAPPCVRWLQSSGNFCFSLFSVSFLHKKYSTRF